jgi:regulator of RNase E activity RraB
MDARVVENLAKHGDVAEKPRVVDHRACFSALDDRAAFVEAVRRKGLFQLAESFGGEYDGWGCVATK